MAGLSEAEQAVGGRRVAVPAQLYLRRSSSIQKRRGTRRRAAASRLRRGSRQYFNRDTSREPSSRRLGFWQCLEMEQTTFVPAMCKGGVACHRSRKKLGPLAWGGSEAADSLLYRAGAGGHRRVACFGCFEPSAYN